MGRTGSLLLGLQLLSCYIGFTTAEQSKYLVAPAKEDCQFRDNCSTLEEHAREGDFNQSNAMWIFMEGKHILNGSIVVFSKVHNVTLTGSKTCEQQDVKKCTIHCRGNQACMFLFVTSYNVTISNLRFIQNIPDLHPVNVNTLKQYLPRDENLCYNHSLGFPSSLTHAHFNNCLHDRSWVFVDVVHVTVNNVNFVGRNSYWAVVRPNGNYKVLKCQFYHLFLAQSLLSGDPQHYLTVVLRNPHKKQSKLTFLISNSHFKSSDYVPSESLIEKWKEESRVNTTGLAAVMAYPAVHIISDKPLNGWKANITIHKCCFCRCSPFQLTAIEDPGLTVTLNEVNATAYIQEWWKNQTVSFWGSAIRIFLTNCYILNQHKCAINATAHLSNVTVVSSKMSGYTSDKGCIILFEGRIAKNCPTGIRIVLQNNTFTNCSSQRFYSAIYAHQHLVDYRAPKRYQTDHERYRLVIDSDRNENHFRVKKQERCVVFERLPEEKPKYLKRPGDITYTSTCQENCIWQGVYFISGFQDHGRVLFTGNTIKKNKAQGITLVGSVLELEGTNNIKRNRDYYGGGVAMHGYSQLWIRNGSKLVLSKNHAFVQGGGIFIYEPCALVRSGACPCFFEFIGSDGRPLRNTSVHTFNASVTLSENNVRDASRARATMIFNSNIDHCVLQGLLEDSLKKELFQQVFGTPKKPTQDEISSKPRSICNCSDDDDAEDTNCIAWSQDPLVVYPGQNLTLNVKLIGDMGVSLENVLYIKLEKSSYAKDTRVYIPLLLHSTHVLHCGCNTLTIPPLPPEDGYSNWILQLMVPLQPDRNQNIFLFAHVSTNTVSCPKAYSRVKEKHRDCCKCYKLLLDMEVQCLLDKQVFVLPKNHWIGTEEEHERSSRTNILLSTNCPKVYCATANGMNVSLSQLDKQCMYGRTGVLCGRCPNGNSSVVYSYACKTCTNWGVLLLVPLLIAGPLLIALICCLNLTITVGSVNGFLLYMNIIAINSDVLTTSTGGSTGIRQALQFTPFTGLCFYTGMDEFASTLLTYLFPIYLLTLVGLICLLPKCRCVNMHKINRRIGPRITPVLATVILLSYTQLAESVIQSLLFVRLHVTDGTNTTSRLVWMFDGSLEYFRSTKHIVLACLALLVLMCFLLPVTVVSIFGDLFRRFSRGPWYMNFLDSFHGAFRFRFGFWIGIRILLRILFIVLKIFLPVEELFLVIAYTIMTLLFLQILIRPFRGIRVDECVSKKIKEKHFPEPLQRELVHSIDHSFLVNLTAVFMYLPHNVKNMTTVLIVSRVIAYVEFVGILVYHMMEYSPVGPFVFDTWFKLQQRYRRWRENRREAALARASHDADGRGPCEEQFDLVLRASDCTDSDYDDESESDDDNAKETTSDHLQGGDMTMTKQTSGDRDDWSGPVDISNSLGSELSTPLLKTQGNTQ